MQTKPCFWCSGMRWLGPFGVWFERIYRDCCKKHDLDCMQNTAQRAQGRPHIMPTMVVHWRFYVAMRAKGIPIIPEVAFVLVTLLYWPSRIIKWIFKGGVI